MSGNREYKSDVFSMLMEEPQNALELYNAINHSDYADPGLVEMKRLDRGISLTVRNDASFVLDMNLSIYEHQSTVCPNMPVRSLVYFSTIIDKFVRGKNIYGRKLVKIPTPRFAVFYNGEEKQPEKYELKLSDAFVNPVDRPELELTCTVYNINYGRNRELLANCGFLKGYMTFVDYVRKNHRENGYEELRDAIEAAIDRCIEENVLRDFFRAHRSEVVKVVQLDYTFERQLMLEREENIEEGRAEGRAEGRVEGRAEGKIRTLIHIICRKARDKKDLKQIADELEQDEEEIRQLYETVCLFMPGCDEEQIYCAYMDKMGNIPV